PREQFPRPTHHVTGFALWYKRLEQAKFAWPRKWSAELIELSAEQWQWLLAGYDITRMHPHATLKYTHIT
ncbi:MAG: IS66 family insertion sequence element accessory protein TnpB, partial [Gammaproteobacteria bacterium]